MAEVPMWHLFAYMNDSDARDDEHRSVPEWRVEDVFRWARFRGYDCIMFTREPAAAEYRQPEPSGLVLNAP